jgi:membrane protein YqaA with SNARE-associated domain
MLRRLYDWVLALSARPSAPYALAGVSFAESSFFPIPPDAMLIPMCLARPERSFFYAGVCTIASVIGGLLGYAIGSILYESIGKWLIEIYGYGQQAEAFRAAYAQWGHWVILIKGVTPIPYKLVTITAGFAEYNLFWFVILSVITRGFRFYLVAGLIYWLGPPAKEFIEKRLELMFFLFMVIFVLGILAALYVV